MALSFHVQVENLFLRHESEEVYVEATVNGEPLGDRTVACDAQKEHTFLLHHRQWSRTLQVHGKQDVTIIVQVWKDKHNKALGQVPFGKRLKRVIHPPFKKSVHLLLNDDVIVRVATRVERPVIRSPESVIVARTPIGSSRGVTLNVQPDVVVVEAHPVLPVPERTGAPLASTGDGEGLEPEELELELEPLPGSSSEAVEELALVEIPGSVEEPELEPLPAPPGEGAAGAGAPDAARRRAVPEHTPSAWEIPDGGFVAEPSAASPKNVFANPAVIPFLSDPTEDSCARLRLTYYRPGSLSFGVNDPRLVWTAVDNPNVEFLDGNNTGTEVLVYSTKDVEGEVRFDVHYHREDDPSDEGQLVTQYRALVDRIRQIPCRFSILRGRLPVGATEAKMKKRMDSLWPRSTPAQIRDHVEVANRYLRQIGAEITFDTHPAPEAATATSVPGVFVSIVKPALTRMQNITKAPVRAGRLNRPGDKTTRVVNVVYVKRIPGAYGVAAFIPNAGKSCTDSGNPSSSWIAGAPPNAPGVTRLKMWGKQWTAPGLPRFGALCIGDEGLPEDVVAYGSTIAHELGHVLGLHHRHCHEGKAGEDGQSYPPYENMMNGSGVYEAVQGFDIAQARAVRQSPLLRK